MNAESAYLFRHALLRDAAYQLQLPGDRARLHGLAFEVIEALAGGPPPEPAPLAMPAEAPKGRRRDAAQPAPFRLHATDAYAEELAEHARVAASGRNETVPTTGLSPLAAAYRLYLRRVAEVGEWRHRHESASLAWQRLSDLFTGADKAEALRRAGEAMGKGGRTGIAESLCLKALAVAREAGDRRLEGVAIGSVALLEKETGRMAQAERGYEQALAIHREVGNRWFEGLALGNLAGLYRETGRIQQAERGYEQALAILREVGNRRSEGMALGNLAVLHEESGRIEQAERGYKEALAILREVGDRRAEGSALGNLASLYKETGRIEQAERDYEQALAIHREVGHRRDEGGVLGNQAILYFETGRIEQAERGFEQALAIHPEVGDRRFEGVHLCGYGMLTLTMGRVEQARERWRQGMSILRQLGDALTLQPRSAEMRKACARAGVPPFDEVNPPKLEERRRVEEPPE